MLKIVEKSRSNPPARGKEGDQEMEIKREKIQVL